MWVSRIKIKHDCTIGNRCEKFKCISYSLPLSNWAERGFYFTSERHTIEGDPNNVKAFFKDIKKDKRIFHIEASGNTIFIIGKDKNRIPSSFYNQKLFFTQPVFVDKQGFEYWEVASHNREEVSKFLIEMEKQKYKHLEILFFKNIRLDNIHFPSIAPELTKKQKIAFNLALENGYYTFPRKIGLEQLAKIMKVSVSTFQEHLRKAEEKIIPSFK